MTISVVNNQIEIEGADNETVEKIYIDDLYNEENRYSLEDDKHTYTITDFTYEERYTMDGDVLPGAFLIDLDRLSPELDTSAFTITINGSVGFYFDSKELYYKEVDLLTKYCSTCLDKHQKERMVLFILKQQLLQYAIDNNLIEDQISYYADLARMLKIDVKSGVQGLCSGRCKKVNRVCCNGVCTLC